MRLRTITVALAMLALPMTAAVPAASAGAATAAVTITASDLLARVTVAAEAGSSTYDRAKFKHWTDADGDSCNTREEVLIAESKVTPTVGSGCTVSKGQWVSWYDGATWTNPSDVDIDHVIALKEAWESGARNWTSTNREKFANDLGYAWSLDAVTDNVNSSKSDRDPAEWLPPKTSVHCKYAIHWVAVKYRWRLTINSAEKSKLTSLLSGTCGEKTLNVPPRAL